MEKIKIIKAAGGNFWEIIRAEPPARRRRKFFRVFLRQKREICPKTIPNLAFGEK